MASSLVETGTVKKKTGKTHREKGGKSVGTPRPLHHHDKLEQRQSWASFVSLVERQYCCFSTHLIVVSALITRSVPAP